MDLLENLCEIQIPIIILNVYKSQCNLSKKIFIKKDYFIKVVNNRAYIIKCYYYERR